MSDLFRLRRPYSGGAEQALEDAKEIQLKEKVAQEEVREVSGRLIKQ